jgi:hypothetical protein
MRIYSYQLSTSTLSLVREHEHELRPRGIVDVSMYPLIVATLLQDLNIQIFNADDIVSVGIHPGKLMKEIRSLITEPTHGLYPDYLGDGYRATYRYPETLKASALVPWSER